MTGRSAMLLVATVLVGIGGSGGVRAEQSVIPPPPPAHAVAERAPLAPAPPPADAAPETADQSDADVVPESGAPPPRPAAAKPAAPMKRPRYAIAVLQALDKVTAETVRFEAPVDRPVRYKSLIFTVSACETTAPDEDQSDAAAYVQVISQPKTAAATPAPAKQVFRGWMFANAPGLHLFQHPVYDAWLIACKTVSPPA